MQNPLVSIGIPAYKPNFLSLAIKSALSQTYNNIEIIVVDDCSPYNLESIVRGFSDSRLHYFRNEKNLGGSDPANNWNECFKRSNGDFFALLCDDDYYESSFIQEMLNLTVTYPRTNVFRSRVKVVDSGNNFISLYPSSPQYEDCINYMYDLFSGFRRQTISEFFFRSLSFRDSGGYAHLPKAMGSDWLTIFNASKDGGIASTLKPLVRFRCSDINLSGKGQSGRNIKEKITANMMLTQKVSKMLVGNAWKDVIINVREKQQDNQNKGVLISAGFKDFCNIVLYRKELQVKNKVIISALFNKIIKTFK